MTMTEGFTGKFDAAQTKALLNPINPKRVHTANRQSHVPYFEVTAHLIRIFGFGNHALEVLSTELLFETVRPESQRGTFSVTKNGEVTEHEYADNPQMWRYDVCYRAHVRLIIFDKDHNYVTAFENVSTGDASNQTRADGHDLALKSAVSLATKRCAINLGDQFGLSLYNKGQMNAMVGGTYVIPTALKDDETVWKPAVAGPPADANVEQVQTEGIDETEKIGTGESTEAEQNAEAEQRLVESLGATPVEEGS